MASLTLLHLLLMISAVTAWGYDPNRYRFFSGSQTFTPKGQNPDGTYGVELRSKQTTVSCYVNNYQCISGNCGYPTQTTSATVAWDSYGLRWCQQEVVKTLKLNSNLPFQIGYPSYYNYRFGNGYWVSNVRSSSAVLRMMAHVDLGTRSDTGDSNRSPIMTVVPILRVPRNCPRSFNLTVFDPDGDHVRCRTTSSYPECGLCGLSPGFSLDQESCSLQYSYSGRTGYHPIELVVEDFPNTRITLSYSDGSRRAKTPPSGVRRRRDTVLRAPTTAAPTTAAPTTAAPTTAAPTTAAPTTAAPTTAAPTTAAPTTAAPTTAAPTTAAPTTAAPTTAAPTTAAPTTAAPTTAAPTTAAPTTAAPTTAAPTTAAPTAAAPTTAAPTTAAPTTAAPTTAAPTTAAPTTAAPTTAAPTTAAPTTAAPTTAAPTTAAPTTAAPTTAAPTTAAPTTAAPTTAAPTTAAPTTAAPTTAAPTTAAPTTAAPTTVAPTTAAPTTAAPTTVAPTTVAPTTTAPTTAAPTTAAPTTAAPTTAAPTTAAPTTAAPTTVVPTTAAPTTTAPTTVAPTTAAPTTAAPTTAATTTVAPTTAAPTTVAPTTAAPTTAAPTTAAPTTAAPTTAALSALPLQFTVRVDSHFAPSCLDGDYFPIFVSPTPRNGVNLPAFVNQTLEIKVRSKAQHTTINGLIVTGPKGISKRRVSTGEYIITWTPSENELYDHFPICFVSEATDRYGRVYQSELRCVTADVAHHETIVTCNETTITVEVEKSYLIRRNEDNLHLMDFNDASCDLTTHSNSTHLVAVMSLNTCGTLIEEDEENIIFKNEITSADPNEIISRQHDVEIAFVCAYPKQTNLTLGFTHKNPYAFTERGFGAFTFQFEFFESQRFRTKVDSSTYPVEVYLKQMMFMQIEATTSIPNTELFVESCRATPYDNPNSRISYTIIEHGCVRDNTVQVYPSSNYQFRFGMEAFEFIGAHEQVYITCSVILCETGLPNTRCSQGCISSGSHRSKRDVAGQTARHSISQGPLHLVKTSDSQVSGPSLSLGTNLVFIVGCLLVCGAAIYQSRRSRAKYQLLPTSETD
ncbi:uncharacterized protein LOC125880816 [Epinephelus fuscoguttatus]|uniref:uncharacterized protein LOC125880816 n=1 Tax=Epinephelus fuscoguttatus TaxID=293821 RepID=UPI0020D03E3B|nr:uncharacterized protein LOC125880816 [Epinephelus fuscoguttatus]